MYRLWGVGFRLWRVQYLGYGCLGSDVVDPLLINPLPLIGIIIGIQILRPLKGGGLLIMGLH